MATEIKKTIEADNYGEVLAQINNLELVSFETDEGYQGEYVAVLKDKNRLFYFVDSYGSCSGCDWLEDVGRNYNSKSKKQYEIPYKEALDYCQELKPKFIVPKNKPLIVKNLGEYNGFEII